MTNVNKTNNNNKVAAVLIAASVATITAIIVSSIIIRNRRRQNNDNDDDDEAITTKRIIGRDGNAIDPTIQYEFDIAVRKMKDKNFVTKLKLSNQDKLLLYGLYMNLTFSLSVYVGHAYIYVY